MFEELKQLRLIDDLGTSHSITGETSSQLRDARRQDRNVFEEDLGTHEFQEASLPGRTGSPKRRPISSRTTDRLHDLRYFRIICTNEFTLDFSDLMNVNLRGDDDESLLSMKETPNECILESMCQMRLRDSEPSRTSLNYTFR